MLLGHQSLQVHGAKRNLPPFRHAKPWNRTRRSLRHRLNWQSFDQLRTLILHHSDNTMRMHMAILTNQTPVDSQKPPVRRNIFRL